MIEQQIVTVLQLVLSIVAVAIAAFFLAVLVMREDLPVGVFKGMDRVETIITRISSFGPVWKILSVIMLIQYWAIGGGLLICAIFLTFMQTHGDIGWLGPGIWFWLGVCMMWPFTIVSIGLWGLIVIL